MAGQIKSLSNRVDRSADGTFIAFRQRQVVCQNGRVKRFKAEDEAWKFLARCDLEGKIIH